MGTEQSERHMTISWSDPEEAAAAHAAYSGLELLQAIADGELPQPPIARLLGIRILEAGDGRVVATLQPGEQHTNPMGVVTGGVLAALVDLVCGAAAHTTLPSGARFGTTDVQVRSVKRVTAGTGPLHAEGLVLHRGRQLLTCGADVTGEDGRRYAHGTAACLVAGAGDEADSGAPVGGGR